MWIGFGTMVGLINIFEMKELIIKNILKFQESLSDSHLEYNI